MESLMVRIKQQRPKREKQAAMTHEIGEPPQGPSFFRPWLLVCVVSGIACIVFGPRLFRSLPDISQRPEYRLATREIHLTTTPPYWVPAGFVDQVIAKAGLPETVSLVDEQLTKVIGAAFRLHPWVEKVVRVTKALPAQVDVELVYRAPVAMIQGKQGVYPIDAQGILLPPGDFSTADALRYPLIVNVNSLPQGQPGEIWGDAVAEGAAQLAAVLTPRWKEFKLASIECPSRTQAESSVDGGVYYLYTTGGSKITWGRAPGAVHPGELSAEIKIGRMEDLVTRFGGFDQPNGPYRIDIRPWQEITVKPLHPRQSDRDVPLR